MVILTYNLIMISKNMDTMRHIVAADGTKLYYWLQRCGIESAPAVLLIHGAASNHTRWSEFARSTSLNKRFDIVRPDMRGNARSMCRGKLDLGIWCRDLISILEAEDSSPSIVVGHSLGAQIALHLAAACPERVGALALIDPVVPKALRGKRLWAMRMEPIIRLGVWLLRALNRLGLRRSRFPLMNLEALDTKTRADMQGDHPEEKLVRRYSALGLILKYMPTANYVQQIIATAAQLPRLEEIAAPTLVLESSGVDFMDRTQSRAELARLPNMVLVEIDATHWPLTECPDEVRETIESWALKLDLEI
jgi:pimeloyl-ACP methyl ester carboxylesterase